MADLLNRALQALCIGFFLGASTIGALASCSFNNLPFSKAEIAVALYAGIFHSCYSLLDWRSVFKTLGLSQKLIFSWPCTA